MHLEIGDKAPVFKGKDQNGNSISLGDYKGKKVLLYFYPADDTPTCTVQACNLRDNFKTLEKKGVTVIGVSMDDQESHQKFISKFDLPFSLIADTDKKIIEAYGVWIEKMNFGRKFMGIGRHSFLIDEKGKIEMILRKIVSKNHSQKVLEFLSTKK